MEMDSVQLSAILSRIQFAGHGSSLPITGNETETDKAKNRRVEVTLEKH